MLLLLLLLLQTSCFMYTAYAVEHLSICQDDWPRAVLDLFV